MTTTPTTYTPAWPAWPTPRRLGDWLASRSHHSLDLDWPSRFDWPDFPLGPELHVEEYREDGHFVVRAELPGIDPDNDIEITVTDHVLRLNAERRRETKTEDTTGYRSEFHYGAFTRSLPLPPGANEDDVKASYIDGILEVRIPINGEEAAARKIPISKG